MEIRKYQANDKIYCREICFLTAHCRETDRQKAILYNLYNDYYTETEPENCFVLTDGNKVVGYIISSESFSKYERSFTSRYLPELKKLSLTNYLIKKCSLKIEKTLAKKFPAHLHIDLLPDYTGKGFGGKMVEIALENLRAKGVTGIFLGVNYKNIRAVNFYKTHGFSTKLTIFPFVKYMVKEL